MRRLGRRVWSSPDILPWGAWIERGLAEARARGEPVPRRLSGTDDWLLWRAAVFQAASSYDIIAPERLIDSVRHALGLLEDHGVTLHPSHSPEVALLLSARAHYRRRCQELSALGTHSWRDSAAYLRPSRQVLLAGFSAIGSARRGWLEQHGARVAPEAAESPEWVPNDVQVRNPPDTALEAEAAADWCAQALARDARARLLIVVPRLIEQRHLWQRALAQRLDYLDILGEGGAADDSAYAIEGGQPLSSYALVASALKLIELAGGGVQFEHLSALLRSPYVGVLDGAEGLRLDIWLREQNIDADSVDTLRTLIQPITAALGAAAGAAIQALTAALEAPAPIPAAPLHRAPREYWARRIAAMLAACDWPGREPLDSDEQQARARFDELLGEFGSVDPSPTGLSLQEASALLRELATHIAFEPASDDVAVTVSGSLDDPIVRYDGVWVAGLSADVWPPGARPDPLIPLLLQRSAGMPGSSAARALQGARASQQQWLRAGASCVLSWPASDMDLPCDMSPLLRQIAIPATPIGAAATGPCPAQFSLERWLAQCAPPLTPWHDVSGPAWPQPQALRGGVRLLELQSLCPFRSFAELRLGARALSAPQPGIDARQRGRILHRALELFWLDMRDLDTLKASSPEAAALLARQCAARAIEELVPDPRPGLQFMLLARERERTQQLMARLIEWDRTREHFVTHVLEGPHRYAIAGSALQLRLDRIDRLDDGRLIVIDYKTGKPEPFEPDAPRPAQPQLPAYALAAGDQVAATMAVYVGREGLKLRGIADRPDRIRNLPAVAGGEHDWPLLLGRWHARLQGLLGEFLSGHAAVDPQPRACEYCHLHAACRIDLTQTVAAEVDIDVDDTHESESDHDR